MSGACNFWFCVFVSGDRKLVSGQGMSGRSQGILDSKIHMNHVQVFLAAFIVSILINPGCTHLFK